MNIVLTISASTDAPHQKKILLAGAFSSSILIFAFTKDRIILTPCNYMKIIVNRGFTNILTNIVVFRNGQNVADCHVYKDYCEFEAKKGDSIVVNLGTNAVAQFVSEGGNDTYYIGPTMACKRWEQASYKTLPYITMMLLVMRGSVVNSAAYEWLCIVMLVITVLSLIFLRAFPFRPFMWEKLFRIEKL